jgi:hypothetical protein
VSSSREKTDEKEEYWHNELRSLGITPKDKNEPNDVQELGDLTDNIKQTLYQEYKSAYSKESEEKEESH